MVKNSQNSGSSTGAIFLKSKYALLLLVGFGIVLMILITKLQPDMQHKTEERPISAVSVIQVAKHSLRPSITGFGVVEADLTLRAKAEVSGRVTFVHPELKKGSILAKDTLVLRIDDKDYQLALKQAEADLLSSQANLKEAELTVQNTDLDLELANEKLKVRQKEFKRLEKLRKNGSVSQSKLDAERQNLLQQKQEVQQLENKRTTLPSEIEVLKAKIEISRAKLEQGLRDLERTQIKLPFTGRVRQVDSEQDQYVAKGTLLFDVSGIEKVTINAQFPMEKFRQIALGFDKEKIDLARISSNSKMSELLGALGLTAKVFIAGSSYQGWQAKVERISDNIDPQSRTIGVVVSVSDSYKELDPTIRPPLLEGNYMQVELSGASREYIVLPRFALHQQQVYQMTRENRLKRVDLNDVQLQAELALVSDGLNSGDHIITSDIFPAVNGMKVEPTADTRVQKQLEQWLEAAQ